MALVPAGGVDDKYERLMRINLELQTDLSQMVAMCESLRADNDRLKQTTAKVRRPATGARGGPH